MTDPAFTDEEPFWNPEPAGAERPTPPLTEEELAAITDDHFGFCDVCRYSERTWCQTGRLIADLHASRERIKELEAKLAWVDERIDSGEL